MSSDSSIKKIREVRFEKPESLKRGHGNSLSGKERNHLFANHKAKQFFDIAGVSGLDHIGDSRVSVFFDYDRDGWQDLALVNANAPLLQLFRNQIGDRDAANKRGFIALRFVGGNDQPTANKDWSCRDGYGAAVEVSLPDGAKLFREHRGGEGFAAQNSATMLIGIGLRHEAESINIRWPSGRQQSIKTVSAGTLITAYENPEHSPSDEAFVLEPYRVEMPEREASKKPSVQMKHLSWASGDPGQLCVTTTMATWCAKCRAEVPQLADLRAAFAEQHLQLTGVPIDPKDNPDKLDAYIEAHQPAYRLRRDLSAEQVAELKELIEDELGPGVPASVITRGDGAVLDIMWGVPSISRVTELSGDR